MGFFSFVNLIYKFTTSVCLCMTRQFRVLIRRRNRPRQSDRRTDRQIFYGRTDRDRRPLYNFDQRSLVSLWAVSQSVTVGIKVDISVVLKRVLKTNQISTSNCLVCLTDGQGKAGQQGQVRAGQVSGHGFQDLGSQLWGLRNFRTWFSRLGISTLGPGKF
jgi:hypothetical protein